MVWKIRPGGTDKRFGKEFSFEDLDSGRRGEGEHGEEDDVKLGVRHHCTKDS